MNDFGLLISQYNAALPTLTDGQYSELQLDSLGRLVISGRYLEDAAHTTGDAGLFMLAVRNDTEGSLVDTNGDYAPLQVDNLGRLRVITDIDNVNIDFNSEKAEDSAHQDGDIGSFMLAVRRDTRPTDAAVSADGDYAAFSVNASGELYVKDTDALTELQGIGTTLDSIDTAIGNVETDIGNIDSNIGTINANISALTKDEDAPHSSGDSGIMALAIRNDSDVDLTNADLDYSGIAVDSVGRVKVVGSLTFEALGTETFTVTDALAAGGDGLETITAAATPWITVASVSVANGELAYVYGWQWACDQNAQARLVTNDGVNTVYYKTDINSSAQPGKDEHWGEGGRIEIPGAASLELRLQIKKRSVPGGNAQGTGSIHLRVA